VALECPNRERLRDHVVGRVTAVVAVVNFIAKDTEKTKTGESIYSAKKSEENYKVNCNKYYSFTFEYNKYYTQRENTRNYYKNYFYQMVF
jgi:hypothetical protein